VAIAQTNSTSLSGANTVTTLLLKDHLGSPVGEFVMTSATAGTLVVHGFGPWGNARNAGNPLAEGQRGFTGHEHLAELGLVHMNGRIYDPHLGRFLQADPIIQAPQHAQSHNRYAYVMNNPLSYSDPSGFSRWTNFRDRILKPVIAIAAAWFIGPLAFNWAMGVGVNFFGGAMMITGGQFSLVQAGATILSGAAAGFASGGIMGGNIQSALRGAFSGGVTAGISALFGDATWIGRAIGGGVNGYLQTGTASGFARGFAGGLLPDDLGFKDAYLNDRFANVAIGIVRDGIRGGIVENNRRGFTKGVAYGQVTNALGHLVGFATTGAAPQFDRGMFVYEGEWWRNNGALTLGNVISGRDGLSSSYIGSELSKVYEHERNHYSQTHEQSFGALYTLVHVLDIAIGLTGCALGYGNRGYLIEQHLQGIPYDSINSGCPRR
jgi:RHS repeat-associated protein